MRESIAGGYRPKLGTVAGSTSGVRQLRRQLSGRTRVHVNLQSRRNGHVNICALECLVLNFHPGAVGSDRLTEVAACDVLANTSNNPSSTRKYIPRNSRVTPTTHHEGTIATKIAYAGSSPTPFLPLTLNEIPCYSLPTCRPVWSHRPFPFSMPNRNEH